MSPSGKTIKISVKTRFKEDIKRFPLGEKDEKGAAPDFYYAFVKLNEFKKEPDFWIIPSSVVTEILYKSHRDYLGNHGRRGQQRKDIKMRNLWLIENAYTATYPNNWEHELVGYCKNVVNK